MKHLLALPAMYHFYQNAGGFFGARVKAFRDYLDFTAVRRVFDIGCGPGHIASYIPAHVEYTGFDTDPSYIEYANQHFGRRGRFLLKTFDSSVTRDYGTPDLILLNGVLHHMNDHDVRTVAASAATVLPEGGVFFTLDGCFSANQNPISRFLIKHDRGQHVRAAADYRTLIASSFAAPEVFVRNDLSRVPYTFAIVRAVK